MSGVGAIILAAGAGKRMGADKALLELGGATTIERVVATCRAAGVDRIVIVRSAGQDPLPEGLAADVVEIASGGEMLDSIRRGVGAFAAPPAGPTSEPERWGAAPLTPAPAAPGSLRPGRNEPVSLGGPARAGVGGAAPDSPVGVLVLPVDYAMVGEAAVGSIVAGVREGHRVVLPIHGDRPGHPVGLSMQRAKEVHGAIESLRDVVRAVPEDVLAVDVEDAWVRRDLDTPDDLAAARAYLRSVPGTATELMRAHRSVRVFRPDPVSDEQLEWLVDSARYASTSSFIQAYSVVAVSEEARREAVAGLCGGQRHVREAPLFLAVCADLHKVHLCCQRHDVEMRNDPLEGFVEALVDASLFAQNLLLAAESEGLGGCMIGAARQRPRELAELLELPKCAFVAFGLVLGHPAETPTPRGRMPLSAVLHKETYDSEGMGEALDAANEQMRAWAKAINARGGYSGRPVNEVKGWTDRMAAKWSRDFGLREALAEHLRVMGFGLE